MLDLINITKARNNLSRLIDKVVKEKSPIILIRESAPQAVVIPYDQFLAQEQDWKKEFKRLMIASQKRFKASLKKKNLKLPQTEDEMYGLINQVSDRY